MEPAPLFKPLASDRALFLLSGKSSQAQITFSKYPEKIILQIACGAFVS